MGFGHILASPVITYPGIFDGRTEAQVTLLDGESVTSRTISINSLGEDSPLDYPSGFLAVNSWILGWTVRVSPILVWAGTPAQWSALRLYINVAVGGGAPGELDRYSLPLSTGSVSTVASGERRINALSAHIQIINSTGQSQTVAWDVWAKAA